MMRIVVAMLGSIVISSLSASEKIDDKNWTRHPEVKKIRILYGEINKSQESGKLKKETIKCELYGGSVVTDGELYTDNKGIVRKYVIDGGSEDSRARAEYYYDSKGIPRFTYRFRGAYNGTQKEYRIYFDEKGDHLYTNIKKKGPGYTQSGLTDSVRNPRSDYKDLCKE